MTAGPGDGEGRAAANGADSADSTDAADPLRARVRGIYATALTARLRDAGHEVVQASPPIRRRFDGAFPTAGADVRIETTGDRQGVGVSGTPAGVDAVRDLLADTGRDTFVWTDRAPLGATVQARVDRERGGGAIVDLGEREGYLPFGNADEYVEVGDERRVQVHDPAPPWAGGRPVVGTELRIEGGLVTLVRDADRPVLDVPGGESREEFARMTELLGASVPDGWGVRWNRAAADAGMDALSDALAAAADRARAFDDGLEGVGDADDRPTPFATAWAWFGRESRFALDESRRAVLTTIPGHHRIKAGTDGASDAVDFVERLAVDLDAFPFAATVEQFGPDEGDRVAIHHGKPDGRRLTLGRGEVVERDLEAGTATVRRELTSAGTYDGLGVERAPGDTATTQFAEGRSWFPTVYRSADGELRGTYVNVCTPLELFPAAARYVDLHVDVLKYPDGTVETVDEDELADAVAAGDVSDALAGHARDVAARLEQGLG